MTRKFAAWAEQHGATFYPVHPTYETVLGHKCYASLEDVPGDLDLAIILTGRAVDTFEEVLQRKAKFAVIFAAGFSETGAEGEKLEARLEGLVQSGDVRLLGPNTNLNAFEEFRDDLEGPSIALITQSGHQGRPVFQGQEIGIRLTHWAPTGNEVDLEFADFARYFADQPEVGVIACYIEGFKDGRTLMLAADHAARLRKPMVMVKVGRTASRPVDGGVAHRSPHRFRRGDERGVPPVRRDARRRARRSPRGVGRRSPARVPDALPAWAKKQTPARRVRLRDLGRYRRAHGRHGRGRRAPDPRPHEEVAAACSTTASSRATSACRTRSTAVDRPSPTRAAARSST